MKDLEQLCVDIKTDEDLRNKLLACKNEEEVNATFAAAGYAVTLADTKEFARKRKGELSDKELSSVAGGFWVSSPGWETNVPSGIACCVVGAGATCWMTFGMGDEE